MHGWNQLKNNITRFPLLLLPRKSFATSKIHLLARYMGNTGQYVPCNANIFICSVFLALLLLPNIKLIFVFALFTYKIDGNERTQIIPNWPAITLRVSLIVMCAMCVYIYILFLVTHSTGAHDIFKKEKLLSITVYGLAQVSHKSNCFHRLTKMNWYNKNGKSTRKRYVSWARCALVLCVCAIGRSKTVVCVLRARFSGFSTTHYAHGYTKSSASSQTFSMLRTVLLLFNKQLALFFPRSVCECVVFDIARATENGDTLRVRPQNRTIEFIRLANMAFVVLAFLRCSAFFFF